MSRETVPTSSPVPVESAEPTKRPRVWPAVVLIGLYWTFYYVMAQVELTTFVRFLSWMASTALLTLAFLVWWFFQRRIRLRERFLGFAAAVSGGFLVAPLCQETLGNWLLIFMVPPYVITVWTLWLLIARRASEPTRLYGLPIVLLLTWSAFTLIRFDGISGEQEAEYHWRWTPTAEELYQAELAQRRRDAASVPAPQLPSSLSHVQHAEWPGFRGPQRDGVVRGTMIDADWNAHPPNQLWRQRVGPGWSSLAVVGERLYTQEQRGPMEAVVCLDAGRGRVLWAHEDEVRFWEKVAGAGPRATPTFADGRIYALGGSGILNCLDAVSGERIWKRDITADAAVKPPQWGFVSSPLVVQGLIVVYAGGDKGLLAYRAYSGELVWTVAAGQSSYSSPHLATLDGQEQILFWSDGGLIAVAPASGKTLWQHDIPAPQAPRSLQPHLAGAGQVLISSELDLGTAFLDVKHDGDAWTVSRRWTSKRLQPSFNDYVIHDGAIYGFDGAYFCCVDLQTGQRRWRRGHYGHGQVLLLADQSLLLVATEKGAVVLLEANPQEHKELGQFQAIKGKTWNHPVLAHGRLYVRNGEEMACYELAPQEKK
jgi:outer membrane protein assembly factor BamB